MTRPAAAIDGYAFAGGTNSAEGMWHARDQLDKIVARQTFQPARDRVFFRWLAGRVFLAFLCRHQRRLQDGGLDRHLDRAAEKQRRGADGLYRIDAASEKLKPVNRCQASEVDPLPDWYDPHDEESKAPQEFPIVTNGPRAVSKELTPPRRGWTNIHRASRNLVEAMAAKARQDDVFVFTLGMGASLTKPEGPDSEKGEDLLRCLANTLDAKASCRKPAEPAGLYCYAATESDLSPCFTRLASAILRISK